MHGISQCKEKQNHGKQNLPCENAFWRWCLFNKRRLQQAFLQSRFCLVLWCVFLALRVPVHARVSLGTLPEAIYDMISREFAWWSILKAFRLIECDLIGCVVIRCGLMWGVTCVWDLCFVQCLGLRLLGPLCSTSEMKWWILLPSSRQLVAVARLVSP